MARSKRCRLPPIPVFRSPCNGILNGGHRKAKLRCRFFRRLGTPAEHGNTQGGQCPINPATGRSPDPGNHLRLARQSAALRFDVRIYIGAKRFDAMTGETFDVVSRLMASGDASRARQGRRHRRFRAFRWWRNAFSRHENGKTKPPLALIKFLKVLDRHPDPLQGVRAA